MSDFSFSQDDIIIFCQAPADIPYVLSLYEKHQDEKKISIFVINVENVYKFIKSLNLRLKSLVFIPYKEVSYTKIFDVLSERKRIKALKKKYFDSVRDTNVYFFSRFEDWLTSSFLKFLSKKNVIHYHDHYDFSSKLFARQNLNLKLLILKFIYFIITDVVFKVNTIEKLPEFNYSRYGIKRESPVLNKKIFDEYGYKIDIQKTSNPVVLFFVAPCYETIFDCKTHDNIQFEIIKVLRDNDWTVVVKGHPRLGVPENILNVIDAEIPAYIPAEFLKLNNVSMCTGIITTALAHFASNTEIKTYSLLNLFQFRDSNSLNVYKDYLLNLSQNKIIFFQDYNDFENKIKYRNLI
jgi:hypothetical protein